MASIERTHLKIIREVNQLGSLTAAAEKLHLTQSALSHTIRKLENQFGITVWHREGRGLRLTQAGEYLLATANRLVPQFTYVEERLKQFAKGERGELRIGMECHPCYQWLLKIVAPYLAKYPDVEVDVKQKFQFGGIAALFAYEIDVLVTPDPLYKSGLIFEPVFGYEQVLVVSENHPLRNAEYAKPKDLITDILITYPVPIERLDIYAQFLMPAGVMPKHHKTIETTDIMLQMVASGRGVAALPRWLIEEYNSNITDNKPAIFPVKLGKTGLDKHIFLGIRETDAGIQYLQSFISIAKDIKLLIN
jgi:LysR family transcriptional regulator for metE and metH